MSYSDAYPGFYVREPDVRAARIALRCKIFGHDFAIVDRRWVAYNKTEVLFEECSRCEETRDAIQTKCHYWVHRKIVR